MFMTLKRGLLVAATLLVTSSMAIAHDYMLGDLSIMHPHVRATVESAPVSGGYMTITNNGAEDDRLIAASVDFAGKTEIHEMAVVDDVMKMRELADGIIIPAGESIVLKPGGYHVMFMGLKEQLKADEKRKAVLTFEKAGTINVEFTVEDTMTILKRAKEDGGMMMKMDHSTMKHEGHSQ